MQQFALPRGLILLLATAHFCLSSTPLTFGIDWEKRDKEFLSAIQPLLKATCYDCHSGAEASAGLALNHFQTTKSIFKQRQTWDTVIKRLEIGDMPPAEAEPLGKEDRQKLIDWLKSAINDIECGLTPNPGSVTLRRLNRVEYRNSIRDILGIDYKPAMSFPGDDVGYGFDNIGDVLTLPPLLMEKYVLSAEEIAQQAIAVPKPGAVFESPIKLSQLKADSGGSFQGDKFVFASNGKLTFEETFPWKGAFSLELGLGGTAAGNDVPKARVYVNGKKVSEIKVDTKSDTKAKTYYVKVIGAPNKKVSFAVEFFNDFYVEAKDGKPAQDRNLHIYDMKLVGQKPSMPVPESMLPESHKRIIKERPSATTTVAQAAAACIKPLAGKAFRRPPKTEEVDRLAKLVEETVEDGESFEAGIQVAIQAILVSPHFLFKVESPATKKPNEYPLVDDFELATRLSYFLWSSAPDNELLQLASKKQLREPGVLQSQIRRMIEHKNASRFVENFAGQWLTLRKLDDFKPNANLFPQWTDEIKLLAKGETFRMVQHVMQKDLSVLRLLDANFTFVNDRLAKFYGIPGIEGSEFRMVSTNGQKRMGILTHASILAVTSNPTRTSPVKRGKWILENLLGTPPPPAPPGVPELEKSELKGTLRQQMEQHRADRSCASCHKLMDPLGMALENYDAIGRWRTTDRGQPIDTQGELPNGDPVSGPGDLIKSLREKSSELFVRCLTEKLLTYALGRGLEYYDRCAVDKIMASTAKDEYRFSSLIYQIVTSDPFQRKGVKEEEL
jgi:HEPN domain-containing protein